MARRTSMSYRDAVRILGQGDSALVDALDQALGLGLMAVTAFSPASALPFFDLKNELITQLQRLVTGLRGRASNAARIEYEDLLVAAHAVIIMAAYSEVLADQSRNLDNGRKVYRELLEWQPVAGKAKAPKKYDRWQFVEWASQSMISPPSPTRPLEDVIDDVKKAYSTLGVQALEYLKGIKSWSEFSHEQREDIEDLFSAKLPDLAIARFHEHFIRLAVEIPEFMTWVLLNENSATRSTIRSLLGPKLIASVEFTETLNRIEQKMEAERAALGDLSAVLAEMVSRTPMGRRSLTRAVTDCHRIHQAVLRKPVLEPRLSGELEMVAFPSSNVGYINPSYRLIETKRSDEGRLLAREDTWRSCSVRSGLGGFLAGYLRSEDATERPMLVLGDPGSGKSLLTKILAARLPPDEFAVVRVELRHVRSTHDISDQVDLEIQRQTNNRYHLQDLTDDRGQITLVVIMDGLDELLQLSSHAGLGRYLEWLADFQERESQLGHPVIAIATARTIVMDRVYVASNTLVIKLEEFSDEQILSWLKAWNRQNMQYFVVHKLQKLTPETIMRQQHLARQPLLLALLALYDAEGNALRNAANLSQAELYERIFRRYLERELEKSDFPVRRDEQATLLEQRFRELSTIAIGMINRGRRFITRHELIDDFNTIDIHRESSSRVGATMADDAVGQFFFLYRAQAQDEEEEEVPNEGYEFIHATFGEFLAARIIAKQVARASEVVGDAPVWDRPEAERHARFLLAPYLARRVLAGEEQVLLYLEDIMGTLVRTRRQAAISIAAHVPALLKTGVQEGNDSGSGRSQLNRLATLTVNLIVTSLRTSNAGLPLSAFCDHGQDPLTQWRRLTTFWQAHLPIDDWDRVLNTFVLSNAGELDLSARNMQDERRRDLVAKISDPHLRRLLQMGWLTGDEQFAAAVALWSWTLTPMLSRGDKSDINIDFLTASMLFKLIPNDTSQAAMRQALTDLSSSSRGITEFVIGGPNKWPDPMLAEVSSYLIEKGEDVNDVSVLLRLIEELDRRGSVPLARKLLKLMPADALARAIPPADIAEIISLSRRHQLPELLSRCPSIDWLTAPVMEWVNIEDITWIIQSRSIAPAGLESLRQRLKGDVRYRRALSAAVEMLRP